MLLTRRVVWSRLSANLSQRRCHERAKSGHKLAMDTTEPGFVATDDEGFSQEGASLKPHHERRSIVVEYEG